MSEIRVIKKYANRRLYDTQTSTYIVLHDIKELVMARVRFVVIDAKTEDDLTRSILLQIILEEEAIGTSGAIFTAPVLEQIIRFYGHTMQGFMGMYLEKNLQTLTDIQSKLADDSRFQNGVMTPEAMLTFMNVQTPVLQGVMNSYIEQSKNMFFSMHNQVQSMFTPPKPPAEEPSAKTNS